MHLSRILDVVSEIEFPLHFLPNTTQSRPEYTNSISTSTMPPLPFMWEEDHEFPLPEGIIPSSQDCVATSGTDGQALDIGRQATPEVLPSIFFEIAGVDKGGGTNGSMLNTANQRIRFTDTRRE